MRACDAPQRLASHSIEARRRCEGQRSECVPPPLVITSPGPRRTPRGRFRGTAAGCPCYYASPETTNRGLPLGLW
jgi:hypothetical protein